jgi:hypothetical protein
MPMLVPLDVEPVRKLLYQIDEECIRAMTDFEDHRVPAAPIYNLVMEIQQKIPLFTIVLYLVLTKFSYPA